MKNITVSVPDGVYRAARIAAAQRGTSVSALVAEHLRSLANGSDDEFERLLRKEREAYARVPKDFRAADNLPRDELYDRALR